jgi:hypothetical protein
MGKININFTPRPEELHNASQVIFKEVFEKPKWNGYNVMTGVTHGQQLLIADGFGVTGKKLEGDTCVPQEVGDVTLSEKTINPVLIAARFGYCAANQNQLLKILKSAERVFDDFFKRNPDEAEMKMIAALVMETMRISTISKAWFSDLNAAHAQDGGAFGNNVDLDLFNQFNGFFKQIFGSQEVKYIEIAKNNGNSYAEQEITPEEAFEVLKAVRLSAPTTLLQRDGLQIKVTRSLYDKLMLYYAQAQMNGGLLGIIRNGDAQGLSMLGVPVVVEDSWDYTINKYQNDGTKWFKPHRAVMTHTDNLVIGTINRDDLSTFDYVYDAVNKKNYIDYGYTMDAVIPLENEVVAAY